MQSVYALFRNSSSICVPMACCHPLNTCATSGRCFPISLMMVSAVQTKMPEQMELDVPLIAQNPELPNGCEATSLTMLLQYLGFDADKMDIAYDHMPRGDVIWRDGQAVAPDPETTYIGNPGDRSGYYILVPGLIDTAESYLKDQESTLRAADVSGIDEEGLVELVARRVPVVVWVTKSYEDVAYDDDEWSTVLDSETFHPYHNLHCVLIVGYDEDSFLINDPLEDKAQRVPRDTFMHGFSELGERAMIVSSAPVRAYAFRPARARCSGRGAPPPPRRRIRAIPRWPGRPSHRRPPAPDSKPPPAGRRR